MMTNTSTPISKEAEKVVEEGARRLALWVQEWFSIDHWEIVNNNEIESPIEQVLLAALLCVAKINHCAVEIEPQATYGKYRVDFALIYMDKELIVECDSQQFHERTEEERRYEKARDRFLTKEGHKVFHYTGKEILLRPFSIAAEILSELFGREVFEKLPE